MARNLGKFVRDARKELGLNQMEMGKILGLHQAGVSRIETGEQKLLADDYLTILAMLARKNKRNDNDSSRSV